MSIRTVVWDGLMYTLLACYIGVYGAVIALCAIALSPILVPCLIIELIENSLDHWEHQRHKS
jgi:hypothetical protein